MTSTAHPARRTTVVVLRNVIAGGDKNSCKSCKLVVLSVVLTVACFQELNCPVSHPPDEWIMLRWSTSSAKATHLMSAQWPRNINVERFLA